MRLIDADKLRDKFISIADTSIWCAFCNEVNNAPTVDLSKHDSELLDKVAEKIKCENPTLVPVPTIVWGKMVDKFITELKAEVNQ